MGERLDKPYRKHEHGIQVAETVDKVLQFTPEQLADFTLTLAIEHKLDFVVLFDELVKWPVARYDDAEFAALVNFLDTGLDVVKSSKRIVKVSIHGKTKK